MKQKVAFTAETNLDRAVNDLVHQMDTAGETYILIMFFASVSYDFAKLSEKIKEHFSSSEVIGCSTSGEISPKGFTKNSIVMTGMICSQTRVKGVMVEDADKFPMIHKKKLTEAMEVCGIHPYETSTQHDAFAITFINGLCNAEEALLAVLYSVIGNNDFQILGGSAGDDLKFDTTYVSLNGKITTHGGVVIFVKTSKHFTIIKENIFQPSGKHLKLTEVDTKQRKVYKMNGEAAAEAYAKEIGTPVSNISNVSLHNPIGRAFGNQIFISSIAGVNPDRSFDMYCRVLPNTTVELMEEGNVRGIMQETVEMVHREIPKAGFVFLINCILRTLQFEETNDDQFLTELYKKEFCDFCGFSSYGEQINRVNSNQTLVVLAMEE